MKQDKKRGYVVLTHPHSGSCIIFCNDFTPKHYFYHNFGNNACLLPKLCVVSKLKPD